MRYLVIALGIALGYGSYSAFSQSRLDIGIFCGTLSAIGIAFGISRFVEAKSKTKS